MVPSSYFLTKITSTKSRGAMMPIAAEGVTVLQIDTSCTRMGGNKEMRLNEAKKKDGNNLSKCATIADVQPTRDGFNVQPLWAS